ncbi:MAG TPA: hypothetical protein VF498_17540, partial [Anaerolineales bacterium]
MDEKSKDACLKLARPIFSIVMTFVILASFFWVPGSTANSVYPKSNSYIIQGNDLEGLARLVNAVGGRVTSRLPVIHALGASLPEQAAARLQAEPAVTRIFPNGYFQAANNGIGLGAGAPNTDFPHVVGADAVWA